MWNHFFRRGVLLALIPCSALGCHGRNRHRQASKAEVEERSRDATEWVLDAVDASDEQSRKLNEIVSRAVSDLVDLRGERRAMVAELLEILAEDAVSADRLEELRGRSLDLMDRASARGTEALADAATVLDAAQRRKLVARARKHLGH